MYMLVGPKYCMLELCLPLSCPDRAVTSSINAEDTGVVDVLAAELPGVVCWVLGDAWLD